MRGFWGGVSINVEVVDCRKHIENHWDMTIIENNWKDIYIVDCWYIHLSNQWATIRSSAAMCCQVSDIFCRDLQRFQELFSDGLGRFASPGFIGLSPTFFVQHRSSGPADATKLARHCWSRKKISQGYKGIHASAVSLGRVLVGTCEAVHACAETASKKSDLSISPSLCINLCGNCLHLNLLKSLKSFVCTGSCKFEESACCHCRWTCASIQNAWGQWLQGMQKYFPNPSNPSCRH